MQGLIIAGLFMPLPVEALPGDAEPIEPEVIAAEVRRHETGLEGDHLTGAWGGWRTELVERGVHLSAGYIGEVLGNVSGGIERGGIVAGLLEMAVDLDSSRLGLWEGGALRISSLYPHGSSLSEQYAGDLLTASNIDGHDSLRLYECWVDQRFFNDRLSIRAGQMAADYEFALTESGAHFLNSGFGWPAFISGNALNGGPGFWVAAPGIRVRFEADASHFAQAAVFDGDSFDSPVGDPRVNASGLHIHLDENQGLFAIAEAGVRLNQGENSSGLPGEYKAGFWAHTGDFPSNFKDEAGDSFALSGQSPRVHEKTYGAYLAVQQMIWREDGDQGLSSFLRAGVSPRDRSLFELVVDGGFTSKGLIPARDEDVAGIGAIYAQLSRDIRASEEIEARVNGFEPGGFSDFEAVLEVFYSAQLAKWWTVQPGLQWIFNPGGRDSASDAVIIGLRTAIIF